MLSTEHKTTTLRKAKAEATLLLSPDALRVLRERNTPKGDALEVAKVAGVMAAKKTSEIIPYCHPLPLDQVTIDYELKEAQVKVTSSVTAISKTGVEMEALIAAQITAATLFDMLKMLDPAMRITDIRVLEKTGGKSDYQELIPANFKAAVIVTSDGTFQKKREDKSGKLIVSRLKQYGIDKIEHVILPDEQEQIRNELLRHCEQGCALIITTGGTGLGPRDVTVEATRAVIEREMPAVSAAMYQYGQTRTPYAMLSRSLVGARGKTIIVNLPGSSRGAEEGMNAIFPGLFHAYKMMAGGGHENLLRNL